MLSETYDVECLSNLFTYVGYCRQTKTYHQFVIHDLKNELEDLIKHLYRDKLILIGYNNLSYDYPLIHHILNHYDEYQFLTGYELSQKIYEKSQEIISMEFSAIAEWNTKIIQIDLMKIFHHDSTAKLTSLKDIEFYMRLDKIEDMPFSHDYWVRNIEEIEQILNYNKHDVFATNCLLDIALGKTDNELYKGQDKIQLRQNVQKEFKISCLNYNDVKIGEEINKIEYLKRNPHLQAKDLKNLITPTIPFTFGEACPNYISFKTKEFQNLYNSIKNIYVDLISRKDDKQQFPFIYNGTKYTIARGGIHSCESGRKVIPNANQILRDADIGLNVVQLK